MTTKIDGVKYIEFIQSGLKNLEKYRTVLNDLNVFPVPDGDTGTNMVMTLRHGYEAVKEQTDSLSVIARRFASSAVFGARGNSGVIVSQFFRGVSEVLGEVDEADSAVFAQALQKGCDFAYASVSRPMEGTMLTVLKDASATLNRALPLASIEEAVNVFLKEARISLANTPELLPILKKAHVVDSGGSGIVYFFEGVQKYLNGESIETEIEEDTHSEEIVDLSLFNKDTQFSYGYCVESLLQLTVETADFDAKEFRNELCRQGESVVTSLEGDKVKMHVHVKELGALMAYCQRFGEFLTIKIDNMTVQNLQKEQEKKPPEKFLYDPERGVGEFAVVAVASNEQMQEKFFDLGADVVIFGEIAPSSQDFLDAFALTSAQQILVFPNCANSILAAKQAAEMYQDSKVTVLSSRSLAECYSVLLMMDFDGEADDAIALADETISSLRSISIYHAVKDVTFGSKTIRKNDYFVLQGNQLLDVCESLSQITMRAMKRAWETEEYEVVTMFYGSDVSERKIEHLTKDVEALEYEVEIASVSTMETLYTLMITFE